MDTRILKPRQALNKAFLKVRPNRSDIDRFKANLISLLDHIREGESEEHHKNLIADFLKNTGFAPQHYINTKERNDLVIHNGGKDSTAGVLFETKSPGNKSEMVTTGKLNTKAFQELVLYYLRERITHKNLEVRHLIITNVYEWYIFEAQQFDRLFAQNTSFVKQFTDFETGRLADTNTSFFYKQIADPFIAAITSTVEFTHFDIRDYEKPLRNADKADDNKLIALHKLLSPPHLLKQSFANDSNSLDKRFYTELLHIIGLTEVKEGSKKLIDRHKPGQRHTGTLLEEAIQHLDSLDKLSRITKPSQYGATKDERLFNIALELSITWINRILFLKLLEAQLLSYHKGDKAYAFLSYDRIRSYDDLNSLFFQVLAKKLEERDVKPAFDKVPYLNSSLFEPTDLEHEGLFISNLKDDQQIPIHSQTVLKDEQGKKIGGQLSTLEYLFRFLDAYNFSNEGSEEIQEDNKTLINASVLGLIFEKINGYKDGSFFTPGFITMYMCRETIRRAVVQKFNEAKGWACETLHDLYDKINDRKEANAIINSLRICDPAVGSGHFLVSALNEIISIKSELNILADRDDKRLKEYKVEVVNDDLMISDEDGFFEYRPGNKESQRVQEALFHEKQTIIENCLFGVDINPNSVKICRLRLWIELLKHAYYKNATELETLPNIDINIKCGNSLVSRFAIDADLKQALKKSKWTIDSYKIAVDTYRNAENREQKREMLKLIADIKSDFRSEISSNDKTAKDLRKAQGELLILTTQTQLFEQTKKEKEEWEKKVKKLTNDIQKLETEIEEIKANKIFENAFEWRFEFPEVLNDDGVFVGFDVVIGNPPWGAELNDKILEHVKIQNHDIIVRMIDSFMFFINLNFTLKSKTGLISQIIPDVLLYQIDNQKLREKILSNHQLILAVNLGDNIFEDVARASCIVIIGSQITNLTTVVDYRKAANSKIENSLHHRINTSIFVDLPNKIFATRNLSGYSLFSKLKDVALISLIDVDGIQRGVSPDLKEAFIVNEDDINKYNLERKYIFPTITGGRDTKRYYSTDIGKRIIYTTKEIDSGEIKNIILFVERFKNNITCKEVTDGKHPFWCLHRARQEKIFKKNEKILGVITGDKLSVSIDENQLYPTDGMYLFSSNEIYSNLFLIGLLNSKLLTYLYRLISMEESRTLAQVKPSLLQEVPVKLNFDEEIVDTIETLVKSIINKLKSKIDSINEETLQIDDLVYTLYGLTEEEIAIVEEANL